MGEPASVVPMDDRRDSDGPSVGSDTAELATFSGRRASQNAWELSQFIAILLDEGVRRYGEVGAREGDTFHDVMCALPVGSKGVALDYPGGLWGKKTTRAALELCIADLKAKGYKVSALFGDSKTPATVSQFRGRGPYDAILIDGDHTLTGVTSDWVKYRDMARLIAFHDIAGVGQASAGHSVDVPKLWEMIKANGYRTRELVAPGSLMGIGLVWMQ
jgi:hypothetical protein